MGAIIRKGGFGYPILISIIFFMIFVIMTIFCRKVAETFVVPAVTAAWIPCMVLFPVGIFLTIQAMNDTQAFQMNGLKQLLAQIGTFIQQKFKKYALVSQRK
jgi:lipopolysaccharide export system permease protein